MADRVRKVSYCYPVVSNRPGQAAKILEALRESNVDLLAFVGFPVAGGRAQLDLVTDDMARLKRVAKRSGWKLGKVKRAFLVHGGDRVGAVHDHLRRLAKAQVSVTAAAGVSAGGGRYGMILWVKPRDYGRAARALRAR